MVGSPAHMWIYVCVHVQGHFKNVIMDDVPLQQNISLYESSPLEVAICRRAICECLW